MKINLILTPLLIFDYHSVQGTKANLRKREPATNTVVDGPVNAINYDASLPKENRDYKYYVTEQDLREININRAHDFRQTASTTNTKYCGSSWSNAASKCSKACPSGQNSECPTGEFCFGDVTCTVTPNTKYCGSSWNNAASKCSKACPSGQNSECPTGEICFGDVACTSANTTGSTGNTTSNTKYCGSSWSNAASECSKPCPSGLDSECPIGKFCFGDVTCSSTNTTGSTGNTTITNTKYCGSSWSNAASECSKPCPSGLDSECPIGKFCFGGVTCNSRRPTRRPSSMRTKAPSNNPSTNVSKRPTKRISKTPSTRVSKKPSYKPSVKPSMKPTLFPTQSPSNIPLIFYGIQDTYSSKRGEVTVLWEPANTRDTIPETDLVYHLFIGNSTYDYKTRLLNETVPGLIDEFRAVKGLSYLRLQGGLSYNTTFHSTDYGELKSLLMIVELNGVFSTNTEADEVVICRTDPRLKPNIDLIGIFIPTETIEINLEVAPSGVVHNLIFLGTLSTDAQNLEAGNYITGFTSEMDPFVRRVVEVIMARADKVMMKVLDVPLEDIFDALDFAGTFSLAPRDDALHESSRRLFWGDIGNAFVNFGKGAVKVITNVVEIITDIPRFFKNLVQGKFDNQFSIVSVKESWDHELWKDSKPLVIGGSSDATELTTTANVRLTGSMEFNIKLIVTYEFPKKATMTLRADYGAEAGFTFSQELKAEAEWEKELWSSGKGSKTFFIGVVPIEVYWKPKVMLEAKFSAVVSSTAALGLSVRGSTSVSAAFDGSLSESFNPPSLQPDYLAKLEFKATIEALVGIALQVEMGLYQGLLSATTGVSTGLSFQTEVGTEIGSRKEEVLTLNTFELAIYFTIPFKAEAFFGEFKFFEKDIYKKTWPIITLPKPEIVLKQQFCESDAWGNSSNLVGLKLSVLDVYPAEAFIKNALTGPSKWYIESVDPWMVSNEDDRVMRMEKSTALTETSIGAIKDGTVLVAMKPKFPPLPLSIISTISIKELMEKAEGIQCVKFGPCSQSFFDELSKRLASEINQNLFVSQPPDLNAKPIPSTIYKFQDFMSALKKLQNIKGFQFWLGDECSIESQKEALVNMAAFLGQSMRETIIYDACDENNWDKWRADIFKEPLSPPDYLPAFYPMSGGCGQLGQRYSDYKCDDMCPEDPSMEITATTNAKWIGAPPPLFCGPKTKYNNLGYWNPMKFCQGSNRSCLNQPFYYSGQSAGVHVSATEDPRFPDFFYTHPLTDKDGSIPLARSPPEYPLTNVEGCCWWGRGVIQTTGRCNFGKLNKKIGAGAGDKAMYPQINFCRNPQSICNGPSELKWIAGIFYWISEPQIYDRDGFNYKQGVKSYVNIGCADNPFKSGCDFLFEFASGIVNRGCHNPGEIGCKGCIPGSTCGPAHKVKERVDASKEILKVLMKLVERIPTGGPTASQFSTSPNVKPISSPVQAPSPADIAPQGPLIRSSIRPTPKLLQAKPTTKPTRTVIKVSSSAPRSKPTKRPNTTPSSKPISKPNSKPSTQPTIIPTLKLSSIPILKPSNKPVAEPRSKPTLKPSSRPVKKPSNQPSAKPSATPRSKPTLKPSSRPIRKPSAQPSTTPRSKPTSKPRSRPTRKPSAQPSVKPRSKPTLKPTSKPSTRPASNTDNCPTSLWSFKMNVFTDSYPSETTWDVKTSSLGTVILYGGPYNVSNRIETFEACLEPKLCYNLTIYDSFGDGLCCGYGNGSYSMTVNGKSMVTGGSFQRSESTQFGSCTMNVITTTPTNMPINKPTSQPIRSPIVAPTQLGDWSLCSISSQCTNACCSKIYSNGILKCTPLEIGFDPTANGCVGTCGGGNRGDGICQDGRCCSQWGWCGTTPEHCSGSMNSLADWSTCSSSSQCTNGCCSNLYSNGMFKCTPLSFGFDPVANGCVSRRLRGNRTAIA